MTLMCSLKWEQKTIMILCVSERICVRVSQKHMKSFLLCRDRDSETDREMHCCTATPWYDGSIAVINTSSCVKTYSTAVMLMSSSQGASCSDQKVCWLRSRMESVQLTKRRRRG